MNFSDYLVYAKSQLTNLTQFRLIRVVVGNESSDLDSTICACVYAYFLHQTCQSNDQILHLPILNTNPSIFGLRNEIIWFLNQCSPNKIFNKEINLNNLIFMNDINLNELYDKKKLEIILVDHHYLNSKLDNNVVEIIDHHRVTENESIKLKDSSKINIERVGSCGTLVAEKILSSNLNFQITNEIAYLLTGPILFDTRNLSPTAGKTTEKDKYIYNQLLTYRIPIVDDLKLYKNLKQSAADTTGMSIQDLLQKDVKYVSGPNIRLAISSLPPEYTVEKFIGELKTMDGINEFLSKNDNADGVIILSRQTDDDSKRQLGFYVKQYEHMPPINEYIQRVEHNLSLRERGIPINQARIKLFEQQNAQASRKEILPVIEQFANDFEPQNSS